MITLSKKFSDILHTDPGWEAITNSFINNTVSYLRQTSCFFPEFTDHGILHINRVLEISSKLIPEKTMFKIESRDIAVLIMAIISHDLGMFIKEDGLKHLYKKNRESGFSRLFGEYWRNAWEQYLVVFKHYSENKQMELFGTILSIENLSENRECVSDADKKIYGDFLRIHHPMLAYQIVTCSFPGTSEYDVFTNNGINQKPDRTALRKIIGIIAKSHGSAIRDFDKQIQKEFGIQSTRTGRPLGIPIYYLMSILRIADLLDAGHERAPYQSEHQQSPQSLLSQKEYTWNQYINYESYDWHIDREYLEISAYPKNTTFLYALRNGSIQFKTNWINAGRYWESSMESEAIRFYYRFREYTQMLPMKTAGNRSRSHF